MKMVYRGVAYDYNPPAVTCQVAETLGKYRGRKLRFSCPIKLPVWQPKLDLIYRGAHTILGAY